MMNKKLITGVFAIIVVILIFEWGLYLSQRSRLRTDVPSNLELPVGSDVRATTTAARESKDSGGFISIGEKIGGMTVVNVQPFNSGQYSTDPQLLLVGPNNVQVIFKGPIVVTGLYEFVSSPIGFDGYCMKDFDAESLAQLPYLPVNNPKPARFFCFRNSDVADQKLGKNKQIVTVEIDNYVLSSYSAEVVDYVDLVKVLSRNK